MQIGKITSEYILQDCQTKSELREMLKKDLIKIFIIHHAIYSAY